MMGVEEMQKVRGERIVPVERYGVKLMLIVFFVEDISHIIWPGSMLGKMLDNLFKEVGWGELDYLLLDLPPGTGDVAMNIHEMLPTAHELIVTTPHPTAAFVAARAGQMALKYEHDLLGI